MALFSGYTSKLLTPPPEKLPKIRNITIVFILCCIFLLTAFIKIKPAINNHSNTDERPNILFIFTDDQRAGTIHALGNKEIHTPAMDSLVRQGTSFINAYIMGSQSGAVCAPSRAMLMTGQQIFSIDPEGNTIDPQHKILPEYLRQNGYHTFHTGKWHNGKSSFARSFSGAGKIMFGGMSDHYNIPVQDFDSAGFYKNDRQYFEKGKHSSELYAGQAVNFLENYQEDKPFFMFVAFQAPHDPRQMPEEYQQMYRPENLSLPLNFLSKHPFDNGELDVRDELIADFPRKPETVKQEIADYYAMITHVDAQINRILQALQKSGKAKNTIIVFAADNGLAVGQHGLMGKQNVYEHSVKVPLIFVGPGIPKNKQVADLSYLTDIFSTLCAVNHFSVPATVEGISLWPAIQGQVYNKRKSLFFVYKNFQRGVRDGNWKLIHYQVKGKKHTQLFNLKNDPYEINNLANTEPAKVKEMEEMMKEWFIKTGDKVDLTKADWGVPEISSWMEDMKRKDPKNLENLLKITKQKRRPAYQ